MKSLGLSEEEIELDTRYISLCETSQREELGTKVEDMCWKQINLDRERTRAYERADIQEKVLRTKAVEELWKHEQRMFGEVQPIRQRMYGSGDNIYPEGMRGFVPTTPPEG